MTEIKAKVIHYTEVPAQAIGEAAPGATLRWLIDKDHDGAPTSALRLVEITPGGNSLKHTHDYEHENYILEGKGRVLIGDTWHDLKPGDAVLVPGGVLHQYANAGDTNLKFICTIPVSK
jgi:quercetin dioxygenase-like cupin family protein